MRPGRRWCIAWLDGFKAKDYQRGTLDKVIGEIEEQFDTYKNIYLVVVDSGYLIDGAAGQATVSRWGKRNRGYQ